MKSPLAIVAVVSVVSLLAFACADAPASGGESTDDGSSNEIKAAKPDAGGKPIETGRTPKDGPETGSPSPRSMQERIEKCAGEDECLALAVLTLLQMSSLELTDVGSARELAAGDGISVLSVTTKAMPGDKLKIDVTLLQKDDTGESSFSFSFTLEGDEILESEVEADIAG